MVRLEKISGENVQEILLVFKNKPSIRVILDLLVGCGWWCRDRKIIFCPCQSASIGVVALGNDSASKNKRTNFKAHARGSNREQISCDIS